MVLIAKDSLADIIASFITDSAFNESDHPRANNGEFSSGGGASYTTSKWSSEKGMSQAEAQTKYEKLVRLAGNNPNKSEAELARKTAEKVKEKYGLSENKKESVRQQVKPVGSNKPVKIYGMYSGVPGSFHAAKTKQEQIEILRKAGNERLARKIEEGKYDE
jgi:hypothetical protein